MTKLEVGQGPSVQHDFGDRATGREVLRDDLQRLSARQGQFGARHLRRTDDVFATARVERIEPQGAEDVPRRHLSAVVVAAQPVGRRAVLGVEDLLDVFRREIGASEEREEVDDVVARLVAVGVLPDQSRHVAHAVLAVGDRCAREEFLQFRERRVASAQRGDELARILQDVPGVLHGVPLREVVRLKPAVSACLRVERLAPAARGVATARELRHGIERVPPEPRTPREERGLLPLAQRGGKPRRAGVVVGALEEARDGLAHDLVAPAAARQRVVRQVAVLVEERPVLLEQPPRRIVHRRVLPRQRVLNGPPREIDIVVPESLQVGVDDDRHGVMADHAVRVRSAQPPDWQVAVPFVDPEQRAHETVHPLGCQQRVERMRRAERVPERKGRVVFAPDVADVVRLDRRAVERGGERGAHGGVCPRRETDARKPVVPFRPSLRGDGLKGLPRQLSIEIRGSGRGGRRRQREPDFQHAVRQDAKVADAAVARHDRTREVECAEDLVVHPGAHLAPRDEPRRRKRTQVRLLHVGCEHAPERAIVLAAPRDRPFRVD